PRQASSAFLSYTSRTFVLLRLLRVIPCMPTLKFILCCFPETVSGKRTIRKSQGSGSAPERDLPSGLPAPEEYSPNNLRQTWGSGCCLKSEPPREPRYFLFSCTHKPGRYQ